MRSLRALIVAAFSIVLMAAGVDSREATMRLPPQEVAQNEHVLKSEEVIELKCTPSARKIAAKYAGIIMQSEIVSRDEKFGYIYRYNMVKSVTDDGSFHPEDGTKGNVYKVQTKLVLHTEDCETFKLATYPLFELPPSND